MLVRFRKYDTNISKYDTTLREEKKFYICTWWLRIPVCTSPTPFTSFDLIVMVSQYGWGERNQTNKVLREKKYA